jgi:hypothetical protein
VPAFREEQYDRPIAGKKGDPMNMRTEVKETTSIKVRPVAPPKKKAPRDTRTVFADALGYAGSEVVWL